MEDQLKIGDYLIEGKIAHGGMAQIYKAKTADPNGIERLVVIKRILPHISSNPEYVEMLIDEAKIAVHFTHGNIAQVYDLGKVVDDYFIVMEYVDGKTLGQILREFNERGEKLPIDFVVFCIIELCHGLDYIHRKTAADGASLGVVHRDISPQNIIVSYSGTVKIIDFGVAKSEEKMTQTESGVLKGKFAYMSPEQAEGEVIDGRSDIFSTGILMWELLTGKRLFKRKSNPETVKAVKKASVPPPAKTRPGRPRALDRIVEKALQKKRSTRYQTASEMALELARFLVSYNPEYRPLHVAEFLYRYFGPEADEAGLPPELPELNVEMARRPPRPEKKISADEEPTEIDRTESRFFSLRKSRVAALGLLLLLSLSLFAYVTLPYFNRGTLVLDVEPRDAAVFMDGKLLSGLSGKFTIEQASPKPFSLQVMREGYIPHQLTHTIRRRASQALHVVLKKEIPPYGDLFVETNPPGATLFLDQMELPQKSPMRLPRLNHGKIFRVRAVLEGYQPEEAMVEIAGGEIRNLYFYLKKVEEDSGDVIIEPR